ncbi:hypothetical protein D1872_269780 [compost metagenome]
MRAVELNAVKADSFGFSSCLAERLNDFFDLSLGIFTYVSLGSHVPQLRNDASSCCVHLSHYMLPSLQSSFSEEMWNVLLIGRIWMVNDRTLGDN